MNYEERSRAKQIERALAAFGPCPCGCGKPRAKMQEYATPECKPQEAPKEN